VTKLTALYLIILPDKFHYLKFILEAYDNLAILSSYDSKKGIVVIRFPDSMGKDLIDLLSFLAPSLSLRDI